MYAFAIADLADKGVESLSNLTVEELLSLLGGGEGGVTIILGIMQGLVSFFLMKDLLAANFFDEVDTEGHPERQHNTFSSLCD